MHTLNRPATVIPLALLLLTLSLGGKYIFDNGLIAGGAFSLVLALLIAYTFARHPDRIPLIIFGVSLALYAIISLVIYYTGLQIFGDGTNDWDLYHAGGSEIARLLSDGPFFTQLIEGHQGFRFISFLVGLSYFFLVPEMIVGILLNTLLASVAITLLYFILREINIERNTAFIVAAVGGLYPTFLYFSSFLLKESLVLLLVFATLLPLLKLSKRFTWRLLLGVFFFTVPLYGLREPFWYALLFSVAVGLLFWCGSLSLTRRIGLVLLFCFCAGFTPIFFGEAYAGIDRITHFMTPERITYYREVVYTSEHRLKKDRHGPSNDSAAETSNDSTAEADGTGGGGSTLAYRTDLDNPLAFSVNYLDSFLTVFLGPFPWQLEGRQHLVLGEVFAWYIAFLAVIGGVIHAVRERNPVLTLLPFSLAVVVILALFVPNLGIIVRIRVAAFLTLLPFAALYLQRQRYDRYLPKIIRTP